jgi:hypothetical protein
LIFCPFVVLAKTYKGRNLMFMNSNTWIGIGVVVILVGGIAYFAGQSSKDATQAANTTQAEVTTTDTQPALVQQPTAKPVAKQADVNLKSKCSTDGRAFVQNFELQNNAYNASGQKPVWFDPQFHFDSKLNSCLAYISYNQGTKKIDLNAMMSPNYTDELINWNVVFDIYSNQAVLQSVSDRTATNGKITDTPTAYPPYQNIPNLSGTAFSAQLQVLMSE